MALAEHWKQYPPASAALRAIGNILGQFFCEKPLWEDEFQVSDAKDVINVLGMSDKELKRG